MRLASIDVSGRYRSTETKDESRQAEADLHDHVNVIHGCLKLMYDKKIMVPDPEFIPHFDVFAKYMQKAYLEFRIQQLESEGVIVPQIKIVNK